MLFFPIEHKLLWTAWSATYIRRCSSLSHLQVQLTLNYRQNYRGELKLEISLRIELMNQSITITIAVQPVIIISKKWHHSDTINDFIDNTHDTLLHLCYRLLWHCLQFTFILIQFNFLSFSGIRKPFTFH